MSNGTTLGDGGAPGRQWNFVETWGQLEEGLIAYRELSEEVREVFRLGSGQTVISAVTGEKPRQTLPDTTEPIYQETHAYARFNRRVVRPDDLLAIDFTLWNVKPNAGGDALVREVPSMPGILIAQLQGQAIGEQAFLEASPEIDRAVLERYGHPPAVQEPAMVIAAARLSGPSRVAVRMPDEVEEIELTLEAFLEALRTWPMNLDPNAAPGEGAVPAFPLGTLLPALGASAQAASTALPEGWQKGLLTPVADAVDKVVAEAVAAFREGKSDDGAYCKNLLGAVDAVAKLATTKGFAQVDRQDLKTALTAYMGSMALYGFVETASKLCPDATQTEVQTIFPALELLGVETGAPSSPFGLACALEMPYRLQISPLMVAAQSDSQLDPGHFALERYTWAHSPVPVVKGLRTELWHTRLAAVLANGLGNSVVLENHGHRYPMRALWALDPPDEDPSTLPLMALDERDRRELVTLTAGFDAPTQPRAFMTRQLMLSALGGWLDAEGAWYDCKPDHVNIQAWVHRLGLAAKAMSAL
jgi:hypothetical protein